MSRKNLFFQLQVMFIHHLYNSTIHGWDIYLLLLHHAEDESLNWTSKFQTEADKSCKFMQEPIKWLMVLCTDLVCR